jgi:hypothetical protein
VRLFAHHYATFRMRHGHTGSAPVRFQVMRGSEDVTAAVPLESLLPSVAGEYRRCGGLPGQAMVSAAALSVLEPIINHATAFTHAPGPAGRPGGYAIKIHQGRISLDLPDGMSEEQAVAVNTQGQNFDGISSIEDGYISFESETMEVMRRHLGYSCEKMHWSEADQWAKELADRFAGYRHAIAT